MFLLVSESYCNKLPETGWLKTIQVYLYIVVEAKSLKPSCWKGHALSEGSRGGPFLVLASFWWLTGKSGLPGLVNMSLQPPPPSSYDLLPMSVSHVLFLQGNQPTLMQYDLTLTNYTYKVPISN